MRSRTSFCDGHVPGEYSAHYDQGHISGHDPGDASSVDTFLEDFPVVIHAVTFRQTLDVHPLLV